MSYSVHVPEYDLLIHRHRFAAWAAARAAQRAWTSIPPLVQAIEMLGFPYGLVGMIEQIRSPDQADKFHRECCYGIIASLRGVGVPATYGQAAKLIAVYLKSMVVLATNSHQHAAALIHPPIDRIILEHIESDSTLPMKIRLACKGKNWTKLSESDYFQIIAALREHNLDKPAFWMLEARWNVTAKS